MSIKEYIKNLKKLVEMEREAEIETMKKEIRSITGKEREKLGRAILNLNGKITGQEFDYKLVRYGRKEPFETEIAVGDLVLVSRGNPLKSDLVGIVTEKAKKFIVIALNNVPKWSLKNARIDLYSNDITFQRMIENLECLSPNGLRALGFALGKKTPKKPRFVEFKKIDQGLNEKQIESVALALGSQSFFLVHGPFGTGKTRTLAEIILQEVKRGNKVLATAESNVAVDNLVERLVRKARVVRMGHPSRVSKNLKESTLAYQASQHQRFREIKNLRKKVEEIVKARDQYLKPSPQLKRGLSNGKILKLAQEKRGKRGIKAETIELMAEWIQLNKTAQNIVEELQKTEEEISKDVISKAEVILSTNSSASLDFLSGVEFDVAVIDEATQATIPSVLIPIAKSKRFVLAGDHKQLPPTILNEKAKELSKTLFEKLIQQFPQNSLMLQIQYRMNEKLMEFSNNEFYKGKLRSAKEIKNISLKDLGVKDIKLGGFWNKILDLEEPLVFLDTSLSQEKWERQRKGSFSKENPLEIKIIKQIIENLKKMGVKNEWMGIITPYEDQVDLLKTGLGDSVEVNTVDGYQGREKEVIIISFVRSTPQKTIGFLADLRRLNTALTRAKRKLICVGDSETLKTHKTYKRFLDFVKQQGIFQAFSPPRLQN